MLLAILSRKEKRRLVLLLVALTMMAGVEVVGVGSILPFLAVAADPTSIFENRYLEWAYHATGAASTNQFLVFLGLAVVGVIVVRNGFQAITQYMRVRFTSMRTHALSTRLFAKYLRRSYVFFLDHNSAGLSRNMLAEAVRVVRHQLNLIIIDHTCL